MLHCRKSDGRVYEYDVFELVYQDSDTHSFLHYNGTHNNLNLTLVTTSISEDAYREVFYDPGSCHRITITTFSSQEKCIDFRENTRSRNFKKSNWIFFTQDLKSQFESKETMAERGVDSLLHNFVEIIINSAKRLISKRKITTLISIERPHVVITL
ncbi:hypothetical protein TNIN_208051 [Trichonephila inaurata madagascariensis]|uniref:Uncharacterized protein n=1 Tax=Trichonephila inaurata madagascariensis TaxID=2747483 RepID=A0A8X7BQ22_9ARAC|nr:hypothetical protein TNIN_208051 [Trichonephila inaurata madagascariensis]